MSFKTTIPLLIFSLEDVSIDVSGMLKSLLLLITFIFSLYVTNICFIYLGAPILGEYLFTNVICSSCTDSFVII